MPSISINEKTVLEEYQESSSLTSGQPRLLGDLVRTDCAYDILTEGATFLSLRPGSGIAGLAAPSAVV